ncbi:phage tail protein [Tissierella sp. MB52-C2]|uniref:phage tail protein n=1 Tax=Tissierella sp. MB52-C2 TaxID=3070999 RepID=UPI00280BECB2|nr:phage tail protein [Tissierella sp. MB52-C2]WMM24037.1 phage tail protein [Tissierella sp. MB52-C2]
MAEQFYTILTKIGKAKIANASALGNKVNFTHFALGDGNGDYYNPTESQTELRKEVWRGNIGQIVVDENNPSWIVLETIIPADVGGFTIREAGVFDSEGNLLAIGKYPETYKPQVQDGSAKDLYIRMILEVANTSVVNLKVDPSIILATKKDVDILSNRITKNERDIAELKQGSSTIEDLQTENKTLAGAINELFQSGLDGKNLLETSIKSKGGTVSKIGQVATFNELDLGVKSIITDPSIGTTDALAGDILSGKKVVSQGNLLTGTMPNRGAVNITPSQADQTIVNGYHNGAGKVLKVPVPVANVLTGTTIAGATGTMPNRGALNQTITSNNGQINISSGYYTGGIIKAIFANLVADNIKKGVNIGGVVGTYEQSVQLKRTQGHVTLRGYSKGVMTTMETGLQSDFVYVLFNYYLAGQERYLPIYLQRGSRYILENKSTIEQWVQFTAAGTLRFYAEDTLSDNDWINRGDTSARFDSVYAALAQD